MTLVEKLEAAQSREEAAEEVLALAAERYARSVGSFEELKAAAKRWTNAYHERSRSEKKVREAEVDS